MPERSRWVASSAKSTRSSVRCAYTLAAFTPIAFTGAIACYCSGDLSSMAIADPSAMLFPRPCARRMRSPDRRR